MLAPAIIILKPSKAPQFWGDMVRNGKQSGSVIIKLILAQISFAFNLAFCISLIVLNYFFHRLI